MEQDYSQLLDTLLADVDLNDELSRRQAYNSCLRYAENELAHDPAKNTFMAIAAERLGQARIHFRVVEGAVQMPNDARLHLIYTEEGGPCLTGNPSGLRYLGDVCTSLASMPSPHEHAHLYGGEAPMFGASYGLTIYNEPDEWFDQYAAVTREAEPETEQEVPELSQRAIEVETIAALEFYENRPLPPPLLLSFDKLYRVLAHQLYEGQKFGYGGITLQKQTVDVVTSSPSMTTPTHI